MNNLRTPPTKKYLIIHQSADLYGSDITLLNFLKSQANSKDQYTVILPHEGPLSKELKAIGTINLIYSDVIKVKKSLATPLGVISLLRKIKPALNFYRSIDIYSYDVIYTNTLAILDGALIKLFFKKRHVWHVHEIIESPALIRLTFKLLLSLFSDSIIFNSSASSRCFSPFRVLFFPLPKTQIVLNGCPPVIFNQDYSSSIRIDYGVENRMTFSLVGRINHWKGHELLVEAVSLLPSDVLNSTQFLIIGDTVPGDESRLSSLHQKIETLSLSEKFTFTGFIFDKKVAWALTDVAISASTLPEPFGMVIIEAFSAGIPVISASHGGPLEIIDDNKNGIFFTPGCAQSLANAITSTFRNKSATKDMAKLARVAHIENFTDIQYTKKIKEAIDE